MTIKLTVDLVAEDEGGYSVYCPELAIFSQGESEDEALANIKEAALLQLEEPFAGKIYKVIRREIEITPDD